MNRVKQVATRVGGVGTNDLDTWGSVPAGYVAFADAALPAIIRYTIYDFTTHDWEVGYGAYSSGTLERSYVLATSDDPATDVKFDFTSESVIVSIDTDSIDQELLSIGRYGDASDGDITVTGTTLVLTQPLFAGTLKLGTSGQIEPRGYPIYTHVLDLRNAVEKAIYAAGNDGGNSVSNTGGSAGGAPVSGLWSAGRAGTSGRTGGTGSGFAGFVPSGGNSYGGKSNGGAAGGNGDITTGGAAGGTALFTQQFMGRITHTGRALSVTGCGTGGTGGSSGGGKSPDLGAGGGGGGASGGVIAIYARLILLDGAAPGAIWAPGGNGGNSTRAGVLGTGGGAGGGGGGGGFVYIVTDAFVGSATDVVNVSGGNGGDGSPGSATSYEGQGGWGGDGGVLTYFSAAQGVRTEVGMPGGGPDLVVLNGPGGTGGGFGPGVWSLP